MSSEPEYLFTRNYIDNNRINLQHYLWCQLFGYRLHPKIPTEDQNLRIADVGTGTGIWLTDISSRLPRSVQLDGFDISLNAAPPREWLAPNVNLRRWNIKQDVPENLIGKYDIIHARLLGYVLKDDEIQRALERVISLLKPGGYLQWGEPDRDSFRMAKTSPENRSHAMEELRELTASQDPRLRPTWVTKLPDLLRECGLVNVEADVRDAPLDLALAMHECNLTLHTLIPQQSRNQEVAQRVSDLLPQAAQETRAGACYAFTRWTVVGQKVVGQVPKNY